MRIIPVLDVMGGRVVRAVGGRRSEYRPLVSKLTDSTEPPAVAQRLIERASADTIYVADLDAIAGRPGSTPDLTPCRAAVWLDAGIRTYADVEPTLRDPGVVPVFGSETLRHPDQLARTLFVAGLSGVVSVDLRYGELLGDWRSGVEIAGRASSLIDLFVSAGVCQGVILLDLSAVGRGRGPGPLVLYLLDQLRSDYSDTPIVVGGGVRDRDDLRRLEDAGADAVLVASALHDGTLP